MLEIKVASWRMARRRMSWCWVDAAGGCEELRQMEVGMDCQFAGERKNYSEGVLCWGELLG